MQDYSFIKDARTRYYIVDALAAIYDTEGAVEFLKSSNPQSDNGYMYSDHPILNKISSKMDKGHSGASFGITIRYTVYIIQFGYDKFKELMDKIEPTKEIIITI